MRWCVLMIVPLILSTNGIKVPVDNVDTSDQNAPDNEPERSSSDENQSKPVYYSSDGEVDSYLIPPSPHRQEEALPDSVITPATYLLPPSEENQSDYYYAPAQSDDQSDWYPIAQQQPQQQQILLPPKQQNAVIPIFLSGTNQSQQLNYQQTRTGKVLTDRFTVPIPSRKLEPPAEDAPNDYKIQVPSKELELPAEEIDHPYQTNSKENQHQPISHRPPPKAHLRKYKNPTKLYPKKFNSGGFKPVPIPIGQFAEDLSLEVPKAKPARYFKPLPGIEDALAPVDEKRIYLQEQAEQKRKIKESEEYQEQPNQQSDEYVQVAPTEQDTSETFRYPGQNIYPPTYHAPVPIRGPIPHRGVPIPYRGAPAPLVVAPQEPAPAPEKKKQPQAPPAPDDRTEFRMHGMKGPHSYQFGYDTGKGKNRQFRYEERDNDGLVKGHYGYMDRHGKLRVVNYSAHPEHGFEAHPQEETKEE